MAAAQPVQRAGKKSHARDMDWNSVFGDQAPLLDYHISLHNPDFGGGTIRFRAARLGDAVRTD